eukprot:TRINITY_DN7701_c0_g1_i1.p1 TRINITY_DN7701_c0_g1~~TRINITY_DN7701_c0_g1_i1.p1  ORF type:complete len:309 (+),score=78.06 TRINITY_DN7701_c0_g1_i1:104-1030(+)
MAAFVPALSAQGPSALRGAAVLAGETSSPLAGASRPLLPASEATGVRSIVATAAIALGAVGAASLAGNRRRTQKRGADSRLICLAEEKPNPEIDPRRKDAPNQVPPIPMPMVETGDGGKLDVMSKLLQDRIIICAGEVKDEMAQVLIAQMLYLANDDPEADITMYINSPGGSVSAGMAIFDTMQFIPCEVSTVCFGLAASMGSFLLSAGAKGKRKSLPNSRIMIHQPLGGAQGQATDVRIQAREILFMRDVLNQHLADATGQTQEQIEKDCDRDNFMTPEEAKEYGLIDDIIPTKSWPRVQKPPRPTL